MSSQTTIDKLERWLDTDEETAAILETLVLEARGQERTAATLAALLEEVDARRESWRAAQ